MATRKKASKKSAGKAKAKASASFKFGKSSKPRSKSDVYSNIADNTGLSRKQISGVFECMGALIGQDLGKSGPQIFTIPGLAKITVQHKPATKARKGTNPFTGEEMMFKAKPARNVVKLRALKNLKSMV